ncbi:MAG: TIGR04211 family SH3 domain-containing protein [gamma proteobacterium symbiont of Taylorina sp.]|nr:TIGR04211 family SH3 domain-containing protein [gamma proteobacterium symbiont of Taylorina sp.]
MSKLLKIIIVVILLTPFFSLLAEAKKTQYVSDELVINMRSGKGTGFKIIKIIKSGTPLTILNSDTGYTHAVTPGGVQGWVLSRFLIDQPVARDKLAKAQKDVAEMKVKYNSMSNELNTLKSEQEILSRSEKNLLQNKDVLNTELTKLKKIAARPMQLESENDQLRNDLVKIETEMRLLKQEYQTLEDNTQRDWFMTGAGVLFGGMILGLIFPKLRSGQRKANWNRL